MTSRMVTDEHQIVAEYDGPLHQLMNGRRISSGWRNQGQMVPFDLGNRRAHWPAVPLDPRRMGRTRR